MTSRLKFIALVTSVLCAFSTPGMAQVTSPILPGPETMPTIMANGNETLQTVTILQGKFFPPMAYARRADTIGFENRSSQVNQASDINGAWTTGDIAPGETVYMPYREMLVRALLANPLACIGQSFDCLRRVEYTTLTDPTETSEIVRVFPDGEIANHDRWNAFWVVVRGR